MKATILEKIVGLFCQLDIQPQWYETLEYALFEGALGRYDY